jgi:hypothetical protein
MSPQVENNEVSSERDQAPYAPLVSERENQRSPRPKARIVLTISPILLATLSLGAWLQTTVPNFSPFEFEPQVVRVVERAPATSIPFDFSKWPVSEEAATHCIRGRLERTQGCAAVQIICEPGLDPICATYYNAFREHPQIRVFRPTDVPERVMADVTLMVASNSQNRFLDISLLPGDVFNTSNIFVERFVVGPNGPITGGPRRLELQHYAIERLEKAILREGSK